MKNYYTNSKGRVGVLETLSEPQVPEGFKKSDEAAFNKQEAADAAAVEKHAEESETAYLASEEGKLAVAKSKALDDLISERVQANNGKR